MKNLSIYKQLENEICPHAGLVRQEDEDRFICPEVVPPSTLNPKLYPKGCLRQNFELCLIS